MPSLGGTYSFVLFLCSLFFVCFGFKSCVCGDGIWDEFCEECDGSLYCLSNCNCKDGYMADGHGNCIVECIFGESCIKGCYLPNECELCNTTNGIKSECNGCNDGYSYNGYGKCVETPNKKESCKNYIDITGGEFEFNLTESFNVNKTISLDDIIFSETYCSEVVALGSPFTYGFWFKVFTEKMKYINIATHDYSEEQILSFSTGEHYVGDELSISAQFDCTVNTTNRCYLFNLKTSKYVLSPRLVFPLYPNKPIYLFIHSPFGKTISNSINLFIKEIVHPCITGAHSVDLLDLVWMSSVDVDKEMAMVSSTVCVKNQQYARWYKIGGVNGKIKISLCDSTYTSDVSIQIISFKNNSQIDSCSNDNAMCKKYVYGNCKGNGLYAITNVDLKEDEEIYVGITFSTIKTSGDIKLNLGIICPNDCGGHGVCIEREGNCLCEEGYVNVMGGCSSCGNGIIDEQEDCDNSYSYDSHCDSSTCSCDDGYVPINFDGIVRCTLKTCGNKQLDEGEECDGGIGCEYCFCNNQSKVHLQPQMGCVPLTCGNGVLDANEECDSGEGCYECQCQEGYYSTQMLSCRRNNYVRDLVIWICSVVLFYFVMWILLFLLFYIIYRKLNKTIQEEFNEREIIEQICQCGVIPFDKNNSQRLEIENNPYFLFSNSTISFLDEGKIDLNKQYTFQFTLRNTYKKVLLFTFHGKETPKYKLVFCPATGALHKQEVATITAQLVVFCTTNLKERIHVTLRYGKIKSAMKEIDEVIVRNNPQLLQDSSSTTSSSSIQVHSQSIHTEESRSSIFSKMSRPKPPKIERFYVNMELNAESKLSTHIDFDEIELKQPPVGQGSFGLVYRGFWRGVEVAIKMIKSDMLDTEALLPSFKEECDLMERIRCPYVLSFVGSVQMPDQLCVITEFCSMGSVRKYMKTNSLSIQLKIRICQDIARGMDYLHQNNIVHRDLKTDNVLMFSKNPNEATVCKISDFGTSQLYVESKNAKKIVDVGTPAYMAPEVHNPKIGDASFKCDVFSFSICLLEIWLTHQAYDPEQFSDPESIQTFIMSGKRLIIPKDCVYKKLIRKCWAHKPKNRPSFNEVSLELDSIYQRILKTTRQRQNTITVLKSNEIANLSMSPAYSPDIYAESLSGTPGVTPRNIQPDLFVSPLNTNDGRFEGKLIGKISDRLKRRSNDKRFSTPSVPSGIEVTEEVREPVEKEKEEEYSVVELTTPNTPATPVTRSGKETPNQHHVSTVSQPILLEKIIKDGRFKEVIRGEEDTSNTKSTNFSEQEDLLSPRDIVIDNGKIVCKDQYLCNQENAERTLIRKRRGTIGKLSVVVKEKVDISSFGDVPAPLLFALDSNFDRRRNSFDMSGFKLKTPRTPRYDNKIPIKIKEDQRKISAMEERKEKRKSELRIVVSTGNQDLTQQIETPKELNENKESN